MRVHFAELKVRGPAGNKKTGFQVEGSETLTKSVSAKVPVAPEIPAAGTEEGTDIFIKLGEPPEKSEADPKAVIVDSKVERPAEAIVVIEDEADAEGENLPVLKESPHTALLPITAEKAEVPKEEVIHPESSSPSSEGLSFDINRLFSAPSSKVKPTLGNSSVSITNANTSIGLRLHGCQAGNCEHNHTGNYTAETVEAPSSTHGGGNYGLHRPSSISPTKKPNHVHQHGDDCCGHDHGHTNDHSAHRHAAVKQTLMQRIGFWFSSFFTGFFKDMKSLFVTKHAKTA